MTRHWQYLKYVLRHKWFVFQAGIKLGVPLWQLIIHDWHKFLPDEWFPYARCFYAPDGSKQYDPSTEFTTAWLKHQNRGPHHWQFWRITWDKGNTENIPMPDKYIREMLADWSGAGKAITGNDDPVIWYVTNYDRIQINWDSRLRLEQLMTGYEIPPSIIANLEGTTPQSAFAGIHSGKYKDALKDVVAESYKTT